MNVVIPRIRDKRPGKAEWSGSCYGKGQKNNKEESGWRAEIATSAHRRRELEWNNSCPSLRPNLSFSSSRSGLSGFQGSVTGKVKSRVPDLELAPSLLPASEQPSPVGIRPLWPCLELLLLCRAALIVLY